MWRLNVRILETLAITFILGFLFCPSVTAHDAEVAIASVSSTNDTTQLYSGTATGIGTILKGEGRKSSLKVGYTLKQVNFKDEDGASAKLYEKKQYSETSKTLSYDQGWRVGSSVGMFIGDTRQPLAYSKWFGGRISEWWLEETLQTVLEVRDTKTYRNFLKEIDQNGTATDGILIRQPDQLDGLNWSLNLTHLTTPSTIVKGGLSLTRQSDRPDATAATAEVRQFIAATRAALHIGLGHYENVGIIHPVTYVGKVVANSAKAEWHQRLGDKFILMGGYRYYLERENPREVDANIKQIGSDYVYSSVRWRYGSSTWVEDADEVYALIGQYQTNIPTSAFLVGIGGKFLF